MPTLTARTYEPPVLGGTRTRVPDFFIVGVPRSGTTFLYAHLRKHPAIYAPRLKEACFTCPELDPGTTRRTTRPTTRWIHDPADYIALFEPARGDEIVGEGCIYNIYSEHAAERIRDLSPAARIIVLLRDPIEQMRSNHALKVLMGDMPWEDFGVAVREQARIRTTRDGLPEDFHDYDLRDKATVSGGLGRFIEVFGRDRIHVIIYEDLAEDQAGAYRSTLRFLGVDETFVPAFEVTVPNRRARSPRLWRAMASRDVIATAKRFVPKPLHPVARVVAIATFRANRRDVRRGELDPVVREELRVEFRPEVERLSELVGRDLVARWWG